MVEAGERTPELINWSGTTMRRPTTELRLQQQRPAEDRPWSRDQR